MSTHLINFKDCAIILGLDLVQTQLIIDSCHTQTVAIISDDNLGELYGENLLAFLQKSDIEAHHFTFKAGEASKTRANKEAIEDQMQSQGLGRDTTVIALGGGVTTDLAGFIASTYCRGVPLILIPTSLLAMIDASIGGKTGVNTSYGKNLIGSFYLPDSILIDYHFLKSLPPHQVKEGLVEMIKTGIIYDANLFNELANYTIKSNILDEDLCEMIHTCCKIKLRVVENDFEEKEGIRRILNFGHTVGHALERIFEYQIGHGQAVAIGMIAESYMAMEMEILSQKDFYEILEVLKYYISPRKFDMVRAVEMMSLDKKSKDKKPRFVLVKAIGQVDACGGEYCMPLEKEVIENGLNFISML